MPENPQFEQNRQKLLELLKKDRKLQIFRDALSPEDLEEFVRKANFSVYEQGEQVIHQGERATFFLIVIAGQLRAVDVSHETPRLLNYLDKGETLGVRALIEGKPRSAMVEVVVNATLAFFDQEVWYWLIGKDSTIKDYFEDLEQDREQQSNRDFPGRQHDEVVVVSAKRHLIAYIATLPLPLILLIGPIVFFLIGQILGIEFIPAITNPLTLLATLPFIIIAALLLIYNYFDWLNDDFIVTTKRVIHIERYLFFGEQRRDAPLARVQDVTNESDILDLIFDSDNLKITTAGSGIMYLNHIRHADKIREAIFRERERANARIAAANIAAVRQNIANQLNWRDKLEENVMAVAEAEAYLTQEPYTRHYGRVLDYFIPRIKEVNETGKGTVIIWRKHYFVLLVNILWPTLSLLIFSFLFMSSVWPSLPPFTVLAWPLQLFFGLGILFSLGWYVWQYDDWRKDVYMVTNTQIIDIDAAAFRLRRTRREGTFDNIQAVYSEVPNFFYKLINLGNVIIETAGTEETFTFNKVFDPASVTREVFNRWSLYQQKQRESRRDATHAQVMDVLREYHYLSSKSKSPSVNQE
ncbi:MAG TPA: cyclic nucleotide-binding domain-containing protein [Anaerolineae bacterium]|nr:cyclic nucleotide-binding domain-containing protein [Anaerolineae bacterium]HMR68274.1 cyclic nucleotide-binding domain-containing protein [Anaerolineae bacterium]